MTFFGIGNKPSISANTTVGITEQGKREAERYSSSGDAFEVLALLDERSPQSIKGLAHEAGMSVGDVINRLKVLSKQGYVRFIQGGAE